MATSQSADSPTLSSAGHSPGESRQPRPGTPRSRGQGTPASGNGGASSRLCVSCLGRAPSRPTPDRSPVGSPETAQPTSRLPDPAHPQAARGHWRVDPTDTAHTHTIQTSPTADLAIYTHTPISAGTVPATVWKCQVAAPSAQLGPISPLKHLLSLREEGNLTFSDGGLEGPGERCGEGNKPVRERQALHDATSVCNLTGRITRQRGNDKKGLQPACACMYSPANQTTYKSSSQHP